MGEAKNITIIVRLHARMFNMREKEPGTGSGVLKP